MLGLRRARETRYVLLLENPEVKNLTRYNPFKKAIKR
jgi:hypothetical protein